MNPLVRTAIEAAEAAVRVQRRDASRAASAEVTEKGRADYVTRTDLDAQEAALAVIRRRHPDHRVLAEEGAAETVAAQLARWDGGPMWVVDPLDGTANFLHGHPFYSASVALVREGRTVAAAVVSGSTGERWWAAAGEGAYKAGARIRVSERTRLRDALVGTGFPFKQLDLLPGYLGQLDRVLRSVSGVRRAGSAALDLCYLAQGSLDAFWEEVLMPWDFAAGALIVQEAGGVMAGADGGELGLAPGRVRGANGRALLDALLEVLDG
ncbi:MAG TPA: inositol monophosphatase family protein [Longimicrobiales bacterium]|nr:inositol monophosphatase family protein [Longimicrobiales bacterium]